MKKLGEILVENYYMDQSQLAQALERQEEFELLGQLLVSLGHITHDELEHALELQQTETAKSGC
jgi:hypothetical protein